MNALERLSQIDTNDRDSEKFGPLLDACVQLISHNIVNPMPHLPNEIWLQIASHCDAKDLWLSLRPVDRQLQQCAEQQFEEAFLQTIVLCLPVAIPTYDMRSQTKGKAIFQVESEPSEKNEASRISYSLSRTEPAHYRPHFESRWRSMCPSGGSLSDRVAWEMSIDERTDSVRLRQPIVYRDKPVATDEVQVSFEWKPTMTSFFR